MNLSHPWPTLLRLRTWILCVNMCSFTNFLVKWASLFPFYVPAILYCQFGFFFSFIFFSILTIIVLYLLSGYCIRISGINSLHYGLHSVTWIKIAVTFQSLGYLLTPPFSVSANCQLKGRLKWDLYVTSFVTFEFCRDCIKQPPLSSCSEIVGEISSLRTYRCFKIEIYALKKILTDLVVRFLLCNTNHPNDFRPVAVLKHL